MAALQPTLSDPDFENWVKSGLSLQYTKDGIENFVDTVINNLLKVILNSLPIGVTCTNCTNENIIKCERNNTFCKFAGLTCLVHDPNNVNKCYRPCPSNVCDKIRDKIIANHRYNKPAWQNTDARQWCTNRWKVAVCYMSSGYSQQTSAGETDLPGLISCIINNTYFQNYVADNLSDDNNVFRQARTSRNDILHNPSQRLTGVELRAHIAKFTAVLSDTKSLSTDTSAIAALTKFQQIVKNTINITTQHTGQILADAFDSIQGAVDDVKDLKETTIKSIVEKMKEIDRVSDEALTYMKNALKSMKETNDEITENINKKGKEALKPITDTKDSAFDAIQGTHVEVTENINKKGKEALKPITDAKDSALDAIQGTHVEVTENINKKGKEALKPITDAKDSALDAIQGTHVEVTENINKKGKEALKPITDAKDSALDAIQGTHVEVTENINKKGKEALKPITDAKDSALDAIQGTHVEVTENINKKGKEALKPITDAMDSALDAIQGTHVEVTENINKKGKEAVKPINYAKDIALDAINETTDSITENIEKTGKEALKPVAEAKNKALDDIKGTHVEVTENIKKTGEEALKPVAEAKDKALDDIKGTHVEVTENIKKNFEEALKPIADAMDKALNEIEKRTSGRIAQEEKSPIEGLRQKLVSLYQTEPRFLTTPISPVIQRKNRNIKDLYVPPLMRTVDKETMKPDKDNKVNSIEDIFRDNSRNIYVVGDAGMGKSSLCKKIVSDWCESKSDNETSDTVLTDQKYMQDFSFVFYISLRDCNADLKLIDMIKHQLQEEICGFDDETLISLLEKEKCLIVLDGLDEWTPKSAYGGCSRVIIPARKGVRNCSILTTTRPWKLEAICLESSRIDKQIELLGIGKDSHEAFIRHMAEQMNPVINSDNFVSSFLKEVKKKKLNNFLSIPVILKQLVCIWDKSNDLRETKTSVYSQMLNLLFEFAHSRLQDNANYKALKSTQTVSNVQLPMCFAEDKKCKEFGSLLYTLSKVAFETLLSDTPEMSLVFEISTTEVHGLRKEQLNVCLDIGILSQTKFFLNNTEEHTKISFLHKTYQEFLAALWISLETNDENKQTNIKKFKNKCNTLMSMFEFAEFLKFVSGMNSKTACELSEHTREITTQSDIIRKYRQSMELYDKSSNEVDHVQELTISCIKEGWECSHSDCHLYLEDIILDYSMYRDDADIYVKDRLIKINKSNIKSLFVDDVSFQSHDNSLLEVCGLEKLLFVMVKDETIIQRLISQSNNTISTLVLFGGVFNNVGILHNSQCLTRLSLENIQLSHIDKLGLMSYLSQTRCMKEIKLELWSVTCKDCGDDDECSAVLDLSQHDQLECFDLHDINVAIDTVVNVTNMVKCELVFITPVMTFVNITKSLHNAPKLTDLHLSGSYTPEGAAAIVECISHLKHIEGLKLYHIDFRSSQLVLSPDYRNLEYVKLIAVAMTKRSFRGVIDSILACNQAVYVKVKWLSIKPVEDIKVIVDSVRHSDRCQVMKDLCNKKGYIGRFRFNTMPKQQT